MPVTLAQSSRLEQVAAELMMHAKTNKAGYSAQ
jgi:hypothetical protein